MGKLVEEAFGPMLRGRVSVLRDEERDDTLIVPLPIGSQGAIVLIFFEAKDETGDAVISTPLCQVPPSRRAAVAIREAELNARYRAITFWLNREGMAGVDCCLELGCGGDRRAMVAIAFSRFLKALEAEFDGIVAEAFARGKARPSRVEREVEGILKGLEV